MLKVLKISKLKSKTITKGAIEATYEFDTDADINMVLMQLERTKKLKSVAALAYRNDFGA
jgi:hypothetical protein